jgi:hydrocephalus-inducing protein
LCTHTSHITLPQQFRLPLTILVDGSVEPPLQAILTATGVGPRVLPDVDSIAWGSIPCLIDSHRSVTLTNDSKIPAPYRTFIKGARSKFRVDVREGTLAPGESVTLTVTANCDDAGTHSDELHVIVAEGEGRRVTLSAKGTGTTIWCDDDLSVLQFGTVFSSAPCVRRITVENKGRKQQTIQWVNETNESVKAAAAASKGTKAKAAAAAALLAKDGTTAADATTATATDDAGAVITGAAAGDATTAAASSTAVVIKPGLTPVFTVTPVEIELRPRTAVTFTFRGTSAVCGTITETLVCQALVGKEKTPPKQVFKTDVTAEFVSPLLQFSAPSLSFSYTHDPVTAAAVAAAAAAGDDSSVTSSATNVSAALAAAAAACDGSAEQSSKPLTLTNNGSLPLDLSLRTAASFSVDSWEHSLLPGCSTTVQVLFDPGYKGDKRSHIAEGSLTVVYIGHPQKDTVALTGDIAYPNLTFSAEKVAFGCVLNDTTATRAVRVTNTTRVPVAFKWSFADGLDRDRGMSYAQQQQQSTVSLAAKSTDTARSSSTARQRSNQLNSTGGNSSTPVAGSGSSSSNHYSGSAVSMVPLNHAFDILPIRSQLQPGESEDIEFVYYGHANARIAGRCICEVLGGPDYTLELSGEASNIGFRLDKALLDFGRMVHTATEEREITIINTGKVPLPFRVLTDQLSRAGVLIVTPSNGTVPPSVSDSKRPAVTATSLTSTTTAGAATGATATGLGGTSVTSVGSSGEVKLVVKCRPGLPVALVETLIIEAGHFNPVAVKVYAQGVYASVVVGLPRDEPTSSTNSNTNSSTIAWPRLLGQARQSLLSDSAAAAVAPTADTAPAPPSFCTTIGLSGDRSYGSGVTARSTGRNLATARSAAALIGGSATNRSSKSAAAAANASNSSGLPPPSTTATAATATASAAAAAVDSGAKLSKTAKSSASSPLKGGGSVVSSGSKHHHNNNTNSSSGPSLLDVEIEANRLAYVAHLLAEAEAAAETAAIDSTNTTAAATDTITTASTATNSAVPPLTLSTVHGSSQDRKSSATTAASQQHRGSTLHKQSSALAAGDTTAAAAAVKNSSSSKKQQQHEREYVAATYVADFGHVIANSIKKKTFRVTNTGKVGAITWSFDKMALAGTGFSVEPDKIARLPEGAGVTITVTFQARKGFEHGPRTVRLPVAVKHGPTTVIVLKASVTVPSVSVSSNLLDFGDVLVGTSKTVCVQLCNTSAVPAEWDLRRAKALLAAAAADARDEARFTAEPHSGVLQPGAKVNVTVEFIPLDGQVCDTPLFEHIVYIRV